MVGHHVVDDDGYASWFPVTQLPRVDLDTISVVPIPWVTLFCSTPPFPVRPVRPWHLIRELVSFFEYAWDTFLLFALMSKNSRFKVMICICIRIILLIGIRSCRWMIKSLLNGGTLIRTKVWLRGRNAILSSLLMTINLMNLRILNCYFWITSFITNSCLIPLTHSPSAEGLSYLD